MTIFDLAMYLVFAGVLLFGGWLILIFALYIIMDVIDWLHYGRKDY